MTEFFIPFDKIPNVTAQQKGVDFRRKRFYIKPEVQALRDEFAVRLRPYRPPVPIEGAVSLSVVINYQGRGKGYKTTRPDLDNIIKLLADVMTDLGYWRDDAQIAEEILVKQYGDPTGFFIKIKEI